MKGYIVLGILLVICVALAGCTAQGQDFLIIESGDSDSNVTGVTGTAPIASTEGTSPDISLTLCPEGQLYIVSSGAWACANDENAVGSGQPMISQEQYDENWLNRWNISFDDNTFGSADWNENVKAFDTNATTECTPDANSVLTSQGICQDISGFDTGGAADGFQPMISQDQWDENFVVAYDNNIALTKTEIWTSADNNYALLITIADTNNEGRIDRVAIANYLDTNATTECDSNEALTGGADCVDLTGFDIRGSGQAMISQDQWDANFIIAYDNNIAQTKSEIWVAADANYLLFILLTDTNSEGRLDRVAIANYLDTNATTECDSNQALTGGGDCVDLTGFDIQGGNDGYQPMMTQLQVDENWLNKWLISFDVNFIAAFDNNTWSSLDWNANVKALDTNATTECDLNQALTGAGDCVDLTGFNLDTDTFQPMMTQLQVDENWLIWWNLSFDGNFSFRFTEDFDTNFIVSFDNNTWASVDFNIVYRESGIIRTYTSLSTAIVIDSDANTFDFNAYGTDINVHPELGATETVYQLFDDTITNGVLDEIEITDMNGADAGLDINWAAGEVWIDGNIVDTLVGNLLLNDNTHYYLSYSEGDAGVLTVSATPPSGRFVNVGEAWTAGGDIIHLHTSALIKNKANEIESHLNTVHTPLVQNGLIISEDTDATTATDIQMSTGTFILNVTDEHETEATQFSRVDGVETHFHIGSSWTDLNETDVNFGVWDDGDDRLAMTANRWYVFTIFIEQTEAVTNGLIELTYPQTEYNTKALAFAQACEYPTGYSNLVTPCLAIIVVRGSATDFTGLDSTVFIIDRRTVHATGEGGTSQSSLQNLFETFTDGSNSAVADSTVDTFTFEGSDDINIWVDADGDKVVIDYNGTGGQSMITQGQVDENWVNNWNAYYDGNWNASFDSNTFGDLDFNANVKNMDTNATTECDLNQALTGGGDCVDLTGFDVQGNDGFQPMMSQDQVDENFLTMFDSNTHGSTDFNASYWSKFALTSLSNLLWGTDFNAAYWSRTALTSLSHLIFDADFNNAYWSRTALTSLSNLGFDVDFNAAYDNRYLPHTTDTTLDDNTTAETSWLGKEHTYTATQVFNEDSNHLKNVNYDGNLSREPPNTGAITFAGQFNNAYPDNAILETGSLKGYWRFDEGTGIQAYDDSGQGHTLELTPQHPSAVSPDWNAAGKYGSALTFGEAATLTMELGDDDEFDIEIDSNFTICTWFRNTIDYQTNGYIAAKKASGSAGWGFYIHNTGDRLGFLVDDDSGCDINTVVGDIALTDGDWHFICGVYARPELKVYTDGIVATREAECDADLSNTSVVVVGALGVSGVADINGTLDDLFILKGTALSEADINMIRDNRTYGRTFIEGKFGSAHFADENVSLSVPTAGNITKDTGTLIMSVKTSWSGTDGEARFFFHTGVDGQMDDIRFYKNATDLLAFQIYDDAGNAKHVTYQLNTANWPASEWMHVGATYDTTGGEEDYKLYLNGELVDDSEAGTGEGRITELTSYFYLGSDLNGGSELEGLMDEVIILNHVATADEIRRFYNANREVETKSEEGKCWAQYTILASQDITNSIVDINWSDIAFREDYCFTHNDEVQYEVKLNKAGWYDVDYSIGWDSDVADRVALRCYAQNSLQGAAWVTQVGCISYDYIRHNTYGRYGQTSARCRHNMKRGDKIRVRCDCFVAAGNFGEACDIDTLIFSGNFLLERV